MLQALVLSTLLVAACIIIHYEMLRLMSILIPAFKLAVRLKVLTCSDGLLYRPHG